MAAKNNFESIFWTGAILVCVTVNIFIWNSIVKQASKPLPIKKLWRVQSIDTMKYSRDLARQKLDNKIFDEVIDKQTALIAKTGATHIAIGTPYDEEFLPMLKRWVAAARKYNLKIWFRGNFSGWEGWFEYPKIDRIEHEKKLEKFIVGNPGLFADGDLFSSCPECENGGPGDPRHNGDLLGHRQFLITESNIVKRVFKQINKKIAPNLNSMNGDVARLVMDRETTKALGGIVVIDHYVKTPKQFADDVDEIAKSSGGKVFVGEFGVPIPDIHGNISDREQSDWLGKTLELLKDVKNVYGVNYWTGVGGSTQLWNVDFVPKPAVEVLTTFFDSPQIAGRVVWGVVPVADVGVTCGQVEAITDYLGRFVLPKNCNETGEVLFEKRGFKTAMELLKNMGVVNLELNLFN